MANIFRVTLVQRMYGQELQNVIHFTGPSSDPLELQALADDVVANWIGNVRTRQTSEVRYLQVKVRLLESQFPPFTKTVNIPGEFGPDTEVSTVLAFILRLRTAFIGRRGRGRVYIPGVLKGWTTNGLVDQDVIDEWNFQIANILGAYGPGGSTNYRLTLCPHSAPFTNRDVTSIQVAPSLGVQRRRNIGVGV